LFIEKYSLGLTLLSDPDHRVMKNYGAWVETSLGSAKTAGRVIRSTYIIGPEGTVRYHFPEVIPQGHAQRVREKLAELQRGR
jgi:peroxiredoxin Q/BCP